MAEESLRETLAKSFSQEMEPPGSHEPPDAGVSAEPPQTEPPGAEPPAAEPPGEPPPEQKEPPGDQTPPIGDAPAPAQDARPPAPDTTTSSLKAPQSWRPEVREHWSKVPVEVQQEIVRREQHVMRALNEASRHMQFNEQFNDLCAPYSSMIAMDGGNPLNTFKEYLQTAATLRMGAPQEKATAIANAIIQFGVDVQTLDSALAQRMNGQQPQGYQPPQQQFRDPRLDQLLNQLQSQQQYRNDQLTRSQQSEIDAFATDPKNEFFEDLRPMVADILEVYANQGIKCSLKEAYDKACALHPEVSKIVAARQQATQSNNLVQRHRQTIQDKRRAALMPPGAPNVGPADNSNLSLRDTIAAAMSQAESRG